MRFFFLQSDNWFTKLNYLEVSQLAHQRRVSQLAHFIEVSQLAYQK